MKEQIPEKDEILRVLQAHAPRAMHVGELCGRLDVSRAAKDEVVRRLLLLADDNVVGEMPGLRFRALAGSKSKKRGREKQQATRGRGRRAQERLAEAGAMSPMLEGRLTITRQGYGFVNIYDGNPDVFIPADAVGPALHGDQVQVRAKPSAKGREGHIVGVVERRAARVTGTLHARGRGIVFEPDDERLRSPMRVVGKAPKRDAKGKVALAEIVRFPQKREDRPEVRILELLGAEGVARIEVEKIKIREGIREEFPEDVLLEAAALPSRVERSVLKRRVDLRDTDLVTIDPETARDHDDAIWVKRERDGFRLIVAIADVSHYVSEGSAMDREASARSTSIYLPDRAIPMLPPKLSTDLASLLPNRDRLCMAVEMQLDAKAHVTSHRIFEGVMRSHGKLSYDGVARALGLTSHGVREPAAEKRVGNLKVLLDLSQRLRQRRLKRGSLDFDLPEPKIVLDADGEPEEIVQSRKDPGIRQAYRIVEDMMLITNEVVAAHLKRHAAPGVFRVHGEPDPERISMFCQVAKSFGYELDEEAAASPKQLSKFLRRIEGTNEAPLLRYLLLRAMQQAVYDTDPTLGHFALAAKDYLHFTSPIRRYPDLLVHRILRDMIRDRSLDAASLRPRLQRFAAQASELERRAMIVERDVVDVYRTIYMQERVGETFEGRIGGFAPYGLYVQLEEPFVSVLLPFEQLGDTFEPDDLGIRLIGARTSKIFTMSDPVTVRIEEANVQGRDVIGSLVRHDVAEAPTQARKRQRSRSTQKKPRRPRRKS
ncbi:MAG: ribonuclease R [Myxococcales bacterium]|nr:ribonuclease R [Myxococcales bacterium]MDH3484548.1 ribonuclease R [Myxococcales bacterium]